MNTSIFASANFLRNILVIDAISCAACGLLQLLFSATLVDLFALPAPLLMWTGNLKATKAATAA